MFLRRLVIMLIIALAAGLALAAPQPALGYSGGVHQISTQRAVDVMQVWDNMDAIAGRDAFAPYRGVAGVRFFPELTRNNADMSYFLVRSAMNYDDYVGDWGTRNHFWTADDDLDECPEGILGVDNAWEVARSEWVNAVMDRARGDQLSAYFHLAAVMHLVEDMAQPAHTNSDLHGPTNRDSLEEMGGYDLAEPWYSWTDPAKTSPGRAFIPPSKTAIIQRVRDRTAWAGRDEFFDDTLLRNPNDPYNTAQLFYIMYVTNQWANYFASDGESGDTTVRLGWVDYDALGFPTHLHRYGVNVTPQSEGALDDNEGGCNHPVSVSGEEYCNYDGDLFRIATWGYKAATKGAGAVLNLFRRTVDFMPPVTTVQTARDDAQPFVEGAWSASPVTVKLTGASDPDVLPSFWNGTGVWTMYLCVNGQPAVTGLTFPITSLEKRFASSGTNKVQVRTTDNAGNTEARDLAVNVDVTGPVVTFPDWRNWYHECETLKATWTTTDPHSGVKSALGMMAATPLVKNAVIPRSRLSVGAHTLSVSARDNVGNTGFAQRQFTIFDHGGMVIGTPSVKPVGTTGLYSISGTLVPKHYAGTTPIILAISQRTSSPYAMARLVPATITSSGNYVALTKFTAGSWKIRAQHKYPTMTSEYTNFTVR